MLVGVSCCKHCINPEDNGCCVADLLYSFNAAWQREGGMVEVVVVVVVVWRPTRPCCSLAGGLQLTCREVSGARLLSAMQQCAFAETQWLWAKSSSMWWK